MNELTDFLAFWKVEWVCVERFNLELKISPGFDRTHLVQIENVRNFVPDLFIDMKNCENMHKIVKVSVVFAGTTEKCFKS